MNSIWSLDYINRALPSIDKDMSTEVLIIGGGIAGIMCAYYLMNHGIKFILVEGRKLASGVSANTTAQLSIAHDKIYDDIRKKHSKKTALKYLESQIYGLEQIKKIITSEKINCDFKEESTKLCANKDKNIKILERQYDLISRIKKNCNLLLNRNDSIRYERCIEFKNQAIFNPMKYMMAIIDILIKNNIPLYENSRVTRIDKNKVTINNKIINADRIIMACQYPFINPDNLYFTKVYQSTSYAIAFKTSLKLDANYISLDKPYYYLRTYDDSTLIIGGNDHFTGSNNDIDACYKDLTDKIYELDESASITHKWFTEDCISTDSLPIIGEYSKSNPHILLITGFQKWGFTNSHAAALNIVNKILNNKHETVYNPNRIILFRDPVGTFRMVGHSIVGLILSKLFIKEKRLEDIKIGSGIVTKSKNGNILVYRESKKKYIILKNKCTHMGCSLLWNDVDKVWISKCHGSIFDKYGKVIHGPALKDLEQL